MYDQCVRIDRNIHVTKAGVDTKSIINLTHQVPVECYLDLTYISLLVIFCISAYVTNTNLEEYHKSHTSVPVECYLDLTYISLLVIFCISAYATNTNLEEYHKSHTSVPVECYLDLT